MLIRNAVSDFDFYLCACRDIMLCKIILPPMLTLEFCFVTIAENAAIHIVNVTLTPLLGLLVHRNEHFNEFFLGGCIPCVNILLRNCTPMIRYIQIQNGWIANICQEKSELNHHNEQCDLKSAPSSNKVEELVKVNFIFGRFRSAIKTKKKPKI